VLPTLFGVLDLKTLELRPARDDDFFTYKLPYAWDADADTTDIKAFVHKLYEDEAAERAFQVMWGYLLTGETTEKRFWQWSCPSNGGKTTALMILCGAMGEYASRGVVPCDEIAAGARFQDLWADTLAALPKKRLITIDEIPPAFALHEALFNQATDGTSKQRLQLGRKGVKHSIAAGNHAKYILSSNHVIHVSAGATGLVRRNSGVGLRFRFVEEDTYVEDSAPKADRPRDTELVKRLLEPGAWPGILRWMAEGAAAWYAGEPLTCGLFDESTFSLHVRGDPYLAWLADTYVPTGDGERVSHADLVQAYRASGRSASAGAAYAALTTLLQTMSDFLVPCSWNEHAVVVQGVEGLRLRVATDDTWTEHVKRAKAIRADVRGADARFNARYARATHATHVRG
jgi:phage/plasmid-associated DNA primase